MVEIIYFKAYFRLAQAQWLKHMIIDVCFIFHTGDLLNQLSEQYISQV